MAATAPPPAADLAGASVEALKQLKAVEAQTEARVVGKRAEVEQRIKALTEEVEEAVASARTTAEKRRDAVLSAARSEIESQAKQLVADGERRAAEIASQSAGINATVRTQIVRTVLGGFVVSRSGA